MDRTQFTFYESFYKAARRLKKKAERADLYDAICAYALHEEVLEISDAAAGIFEVIRPNLDASRRKAKSGKQGGGRKQSESKPEAKDEQEQTEATAKQDKEQEKEEDKDKEQMLLPPTPCAEPVASVLSDYLDRVNPSASQASLDELKGYAEELGEAVCKRAIDIALDGKKATWPYIRAILRDKQARGVRCLADWEALEERREKSGTGGFGYEYGSMEGSL